MQPAPLKFSTGFARVQVGSFVGPSLTASTTPWTPSQPEARLIADFFDHGYVVTGADGDQPKNVDVPFLYGTAFSRFEQAIAASRRLLDLQADWDDEGAEAPSRSALQSAHDFTIRLARLVNSVDLLDDLVTPTFTPGPRASIDTHWRGTNYEFVANFPHDKPGIAAFYADNLGLQTLKGVQGYTVAADLLARWFLALHR